MTTATTASPIGCRLVAACTGEVLVRMLPVVLVTLTTALAAPPSSACTTFLLKHGHVLSKLPPGAVDRVVRYRELLPCAT